MAHTKNVDQNRLVYFAPVGQGGLANYAACQAAAISSQGVPTLVVGRKHLEPVLRTQNPQASFVEIPEMECAKGRVQRALSMVSQMRQDIACLEKAAQKFNATAMLMASYVEYFSPFWAGRLRRLQKRGLRTGTVVHDPVRDFRMGPVPWHRWSISQAYSFVDVAYVHDARPLDTGWPPQDLALEQIPHGLYRVPCSPNAIDPSDMRLELGIPDDATVVLSFGHIRDGKNLNLLIESIAKQSNVHLLVVGREQSSSQRPVSWYQGLAAELRVTERCHWVNEFVRDQDVHRYFAAADIVSLLYSADFRSASGVLNNAAQFELPVLGSSGGGPLRDLIERYSLGIWVPPDDLASATEGLRKLVSDPPHQLGWSEYRRDHDWDRNAEIVIQSLFGGKSKLVPEPN